MELLAVKKSDLETLIREKLLKAFNRVNLSEDDFKDFRISINKTLVRIHLVPKDENNLPVIFNKVGHEDNLVFEEIREATFKNVLYGLTHQNGNEVAIILVHTYDIIEN